jgi:ribosomal protein S18 acetylase RimI-like enzyme
VTSLIVEPSNSLATELNSFLDERIFEFNVQATGFSDGKPFAGVVRDEAGNIVAAIDGHTWGGCCQVVHLWVHESRRRHGHGSALLRLVEEEAVLRGCVQAQLLTHSFQAPAFYERAGYVRAATIENYPQGHAQHVYVKVLKGESGA